MKRQTLSAIHAVLCERFEVGAEQALDDLVALANELIQEELLQPERGWVRMEQKKEQYVQPVVVKHELLRDITAGQSSYNCDEKTVRLN